MTLLLHKEVTNKVEEANQKEEASEVHDQEEMLGETLVPRSRQAGHSQNVFHQKMARSATFNERDCSNLQCCCHNGVNIRVEIQGKRLLV